MSKKHTLNRCAFYFLGGSRLPNSISVKLVERLLRKARTKHKSDLSIFFDMHKAKLVARVASSSPDNPSFLFSTKVYMRV